MIPSGDGMALVPVRASFRPDQGDFPSIVEFNEPRSTPAAVSLPTCPESSPTLWKFL